MQTQPISATDTNNMASPKRVTLEVSAATLEQLTEEAKDLGVSVERYAVTLLEQALRPYAGFETADSDHVDL